MSRGSGGRVTGGDVRVSGPNLQQSCQTKTLKNVLTPFTSVKPPIMKRSLLLPVAILITLALVNGASGQFAQLTLQSQPGDFIGQGQTVNITYTPSNSALFVARVVAFTANGKPDFVDFVLGNPGANPDTFATLDFSTAGLGIAIVPGTYGLSGNTAQRADFAEPGHAGLDVSFQGRGSNTLTGNFTVTDATFFLDASNTVEIGSFGASFEQHSEGAVPALFGTFTVSQLRCANGAGW
jgi:hypothetical protein